MKLTLEYCIDDAEQTEKILRCRRQIIKIRKKRENAIRRNEATKGYHEERMKIGTYRLKKAIRSNHSHHHYMEAAKRQCNLMPSLGFVQTHAKVLQAKRTQDLMRSYIIIMKVQNEQLSQHLTYVRESQRQIVQELQAATKIINGQLSKSICFNFRRLLCKQSDSRKVDMGLKSSQECV